MVFGRKHRRMIYARQCLVPRTQYEAEMTALVKPIAVSPLQHFAAGSHTPSFGT